MTSRLDYQFCQKTWVHRTEGLKLPHTQSTYAGRTVQELYNRQLATKTNYRIELQKEGNTV